MRLIVGGLGVALDLRVLMVVLIDVGLLLLGVQDGDALTKLSVVCSAFVNSSQFGNVSFGK